LSITLIDASRKKVNFLKHVIRSLNLDGIVALHIRAEDLATEPTYHQRFDFVISRALTDLESFVHQALPLLTQEGSIIALKGKVDQTEVETVKSIAPEKLNNSNSDQNRYPVAVEKYKLPFTQSKRSIIAIRRSH